MDGALDVILDVVDRAQKSLCDVTMVRIDAGFPSTTLLAGLAARGSRLKSRGCGPGCGPTPCATGSARALHETATGAAACGTAHVALRIALLNG